MTNTKLSAEDLIELIGMNTFPINFNHIHYESCEDLVIQFVDQQFNDGRLAALEEAEDACAENRCSRCEQLIYAIRNLAQTENDGGVK